MKYKNCWENKNCGREKECPAYPNNGRLCFVVTGTECGGVTQGSYSDKIMNCRRNCEFYTDIIQEVRNKVNDLPTVATTDK